MTNKSSFQDKKYFNLYKLSRKYLPLTVFKKPLLKRTGRQHLKSYLLELGFFSLTNSLGVLAILLNSSLTIVYIVYLTIIALNSWYSGFRYGVFSILASFASIYYFFGLSQNLVDNPLLYLLPFGLLLSYLFDITRKSSLIQSYKKREEEFSKYFVNLHQENLKLKKDIRARDEFLSIASHELKTPLTSMLLQLNLTLNKIRHAPLAKFSVSDLMKTLENAEKQIEKLSKMISDLLNVSLITTGRLSLDKEKINLAETVRDALKNFEAEIKEKGYKVALEAKKPVFGNFDKVRIEQVITNILSNALKYGEGNPIQVKVYNSSKNAKIEVRDQGQGIAPKQQKILFEKFLRATSSKQGLGVGLYIANQIVRAHAGHIRIKSKLKKGSTFTVELPTK